MIVKEELAVTDIDDIVGIVIVQLMMQSLLEILTKRKKQAFYKLIDVHSVKNVLDESISSISMWIIVNQ